MTDWSQKMAEKLRKRSEAQTLRSTQFVLEQKLKREIGPSLWQEVTSSIDIEANALNDEMGETIVTVEKATGSELSLVAQLTDMVKRSTIRFEAEIGKLTWKNDKGIGDARELGIGRDGKMAFHSGMVPSTPESISKQILENLLTEGG